MSSMTDYLENKLVDHLLRATAYTAPTSTYWALIRCTAGSAISPRSTAVTVGQTTVPATYNGHMYKCTTAGTTGSGEPTWVTTNSSTTSDGTAVWTEMYTDFETNSAALIAAECTGLSGYARATVAAGLSTWNATQGGTGSVSSGSTGTVTNANTLSYAPTATWGPVGAVVAYDAITTGNALIYSVLTLPKTINSGDTVTFPAAALSFQQDN